MSNHEYMSAILEFLACEGKANIYQIWKKLNEKLQTKFDYSTVYRNLKAMEKDGFVEYVEIKKRKAKVYYLTDKGLAEARIRGYISFEVWRQRLIEFEHMHYRKNARQTFRKFVKKSGVIPALVAILKERKEKERLKQIFYIFNRAIYIRELERNFDTFINEEKSAGYYYDRLEKIVVGEILLEIFPTLTSEDKDKFLRQLSENDLVLLKDIIQERIKNNKELMKMFKQALKNCKSILSELETFHAKIARANSINFTF